MRASAKKSVARFRSAFPDLDGASSKQIQRLLNVDKSSKKLVDIKLKENNGNIKHIYSY